MTQQESGRLLACVDNTTLQGTDSAESVRRFCQHTLDLCQQAQQRVAAVCVYPAFIHVAKEVLQGSGIEVASVAGAFPHGQLPIEWKIREVEGCVKEGADEVDIVINRGLVIEGRMEEAEREVALMKAACGAARLKVILETGELSTAEQIEQASWAAMRGGADFIKTSTGKGSVGATLSAASIMLNCIKDNVKINKKTVGFKAAGGIRTPENAMEYAKMAEEILGADFVRKQTFRIGASQLTDSLASILTF